MRLHSLWYSACTLAKQQNMDPEDKKKKISEMPQDWKELADLYFDMFDEHGFEWFPEGTSALDKQCISNMMINQATTLCIRVTNAYH